MVVGACTLAGGATQAAESTRLGERVLKPAPSRSIGDGEGVSAASPGITRVMLSLGGVVALIIATGWLYRRLCARQGGVGGAIVLVSRTLLTPRHQVLLVRAGRRLLVVGDSGHGMNLLCQVSDPEEIADLLGTAAGGVDSTSAEEAPPDPGLADVPVAGHPPSLELARTEIRALIQRVRGLSTEAPASTSTTETAT